MSTWVCANCGGDNPEGMNFCGHCGSSAVATAGAPEQNVADALRSFVAGPVADKLVEAGGRLPEERRLITALFADVSGFTSLADRLDPEQLLEVIDPVISGLSSVVGRYGGYVEKFAGDALMALFGAPVSHEDDAARALRVALEMHTELARLVEDLPHDAELTLHVGINSGHGIARILGSEARMDYAVLGDSVILAQRLESAAPPGETYVSETTMQLTDGQFEFEPVGLLELKGKSQPVSAWKLLGSRKERRAVAVTQLVGREAELARIAAYVQSPHGVLTVTGEPGLGKSRLVDAARSDAHARGLEWLETRCLSYGVGLAYWPYTELLRTAGGRPADPHFDRLLGGDELAELEPEAFRRGLYDAFARWLGALDEAVVTIEDLHWADASTLALTGALARAGVNLLLSARPGADLSDIPGDRIELGPVGAESAAAIATATLGGKPERRLETLLVDRTGGNPFFVQELARALRDTGRITTRNGVWRLAGEVQAEDVPPTIEGVLAARIDLLHRSAAEVLGTASVIGRRVPMQLLHAVSPGIKTETLEVLVGAGLLERPVDDEVSFHHALVQDVAYARLLRRRRRELHLKVADVAESLYGAGDDVVDLLARHLYLGGAGDKAVAYLVRAGERAAHLYANEEALLHFTHASELAPEDMEIRLRLADLHELVGNYDDALAAYDAVLGPVPGDVRAWRGLAATYRKRGEYLSAFMTVNDAFETEALRGEDLSPLWLEAGWSLSVSGRVEQAIEVLQAGLEAAREDTPVIGHIMLQLARAEILEERPDGAIAHVRRAREVFERSGDERGLATAMRIAGDAYRVAGALDDAAASLREGLALAERTGSVEEIGGCLINLGIVEFDRGNLAEAIASDRHAIEEFERVGHGSGRAVGYANIAHKLTEAGELDEAAEWCERALRLGESLGHSRTVADAIDTLARISLRQERFDEASARGEEAARLYREMGSPAQAGDALLVAAEASEQAGDEERARALEAQARSLVDV